MKLLVVLALLTACGSTPPVAPEQFCRTVTTTHPVTNAQGDTLSLVTTSTRVCQ